VETDEVLGIVAGSLDAALADVEGDPIGGVTLRAVETAAPRPGA
jgi:hypothetical protein